MACVRCAGVAKLIGCIDNMAKVLGCTKAPKAWGAEGIKAVQDAGLQHVGSGKCACDGHVCGCAGVSGDDGGAGVGVMWV
eukprot:2371289-Lingulodinium_polyedra.AAC.1